MSVTRILITATLVLFMASCSKYKERGAIFSYAGYMRSATDSTLLPNTNFILFDERMTSVLGGEGDRQTINFSTDSTGFFLIAFKQIRHARQGICWPDDIPRYVDECPGQFDTAVWINERHTYYGDVYIKP